MRRGSQSWDSGARRGALEGEFCSPKCDGGPLLKDSGTDGGRPAVSKHDTGMRDANSDALLSVRPCDSTVRHCPSSPARREVSEQSSPERNRTHPPPNSVEAECTIGPVHYGKKGERIHGGILERTDAPESVGESSLSSRQSSVAQAHQRSTRARFCTHTISLDSTTPQRVTHKSCRPLIPKAVGAGEKVELAAVRVGRGGKIVSGVVLRKSQRA